MGAVKVASAASGAVVERKLTREEELAAVVAKIKVMTPTSQAKRVVPVVKDAQTAALAPAATPKDDEKDASAPAPQRDDELETSTPAPLSKDEEDANWDADSDDAGLSVIQRPGPATKGVKRAPMACEELAADEPKLPKKAKEKDKKEKDKDKKEKEKDKEKKDKDEKDKEKKDKEKDKEKDKDKKEKRDKDKDKTKGDNKRK